MLCPFRITNSASFVAATERGHARTALREDVHAGDAPSRSLSGLTVNEDFESINALLSSPKQLCANASSEEHVELPLAPSKKLVASAEAQSSQGKSTNQLLSTLSLTISSKV